MTFQPFIWSLSAALAHGVAILTADWMRTRFLSKGQWFAVVGRERRPVIANSIRVAWAARLPDILRCLCGACCFRRRQSRLPKGTLPYALLPAATGGFYGYHLDNVELGQRPSRLWEIGSQALVTALCGLVAGASLAGARRRQYSATTRLCDPRDFAGSSGGRLARVVPAPSRSKPSLAGKPSDADLQPSRSVKLLLNVTDLKGCLVSGEPRYLAS